MLNRKRHVGMLVVCLVLLAACGTPAPAAPATAGPASTRAAEAAPSLDKLPLYFVANQGQTDPQVNFYVPGQDNTIYFSPAGLTFALAPVPSARPAPAAAQGWAVKLDFVGADPNVQPVGEAQTAAVFSYFQGEQSQWKAGLASYAQVRYPDLWPGIDLVYSGQGNQMKYQFEVQPGADPAQIRLAYRGASRVALTAAGQLEVSTPVGGFQDAAPMAYQMKAGQRLPVAMRYQLDAGEAGSAPYGFRVGAYDASLPLVLDPAVVLYAGYIGGTGADLGLGIAVDQDGFAYITGQTGSTQTTFPVQAGPYLVNGGGTDAFVTKVNAAGTALVYSGFIGGAGVDGGAGIAVDGTGNAYIVGYTTSNQTTFPVRGGPDLTFNGLQDAFVAKVNPAGTALVYSGYIGGSGVDAGTGIALDKDGNAYVTGQTNSDETTFPKKVGPDLIANGGRDAFVAKVNAAGSALVYAGYIGGADEDQGNGIAVDGLGNAYVVGYAYSNQLSFPVKIGPDLSFNGGNGDVFVAKVNAGGASLDYAGYIGGFEQDNGTGIAVDKAGNAYVAGSTISAQNSFPAAIGPDTTYNGGTEAFVAKVNAGGASLAYAGYIGGAGTDGATGIAIDGDGNAYVVGTTNSTETSFPVLGGPDLSANGGYDAFVAKVNAAGTALAYAGYIGGSAQDNGQGIAVDGAGKAYVTGFTQSTQSTFPVTGGPDLTANGAADAFVVKVGMPFVPTHFLHLPLVVR